jgi:hypothetical protein
VYESAKGSPPNSLWQFTANTLVGSCSGFVSFFFTQWISGDPDLRPRNLPFNYLFAVVAGYVGELFYNRLVEQAWKNNKRKDSSRTTTDTSVPTEE